MYIDNWNVGAVTDYDSSLQQQSDNKLNYKWNPNKVLPAVTANENYNTKYVTGFQVYKNGSLDKTITYNGLYDYVFVAGNTYELRATLATGKYNVIMMGISKDTGSEATEGVVTANGKATYVESFKFNSKTDRTFWYGNNYKATRSGYTFEGWYANGEEQLGNGCTWLGISMTAYAMWGNTVTYNANGGSVSPATQTYKVGTSISSLPTPTKANYVFDGWYNGNTKYTSVPAGTGNITLVAQWKEPTAPALTFYGAKNPNGAVSIDRVGWGAITAFNDRLQQQSNKLNYKWDPNKTLPTVLSTADPANKYVTGFQIYKNGTLDQTVTYNGLYDYVFVAGNTYELKATLATGKYNVIMHARSNGSSANAVEGVNTKNGKATYVESITTWTYWYHSNGSYNATRSGYTRLGWYGNGIEFDTTKAYHWNGVSMDVYAVWGNTVTYNADGGSVSPASQTYKVGSSISTLPTPTKTGYTFGGWYNGNTKYTSIPAGTGDITLKAKWTANTGTVTYYSNYSGGPTQSNTYTYNSSYTVKGNNTFTRTGYNLLGWSTSSAASYTDDTWIAGRTFSNFTLRTSGNVNLYAVWHCNQYKLTFNANGGSCSESYRWYTINDQVTNLPTPTRTGYKFDGWYENNTKVTQYNKGTIGDKTLVAKWTTNYPTIKFIGGADSQTKDGIRTLVDRSAGTKTFESDVTNTKENGSVQKSSNVLDLQSNGTFKWKTNRVIPFYLTLVNDSGQWKDEVTPSCISGFNVYKNGSFVKYIDYMDIYNFNFEAGATYEMHPKELLGYRNYFFNALTWEGSGGDGAISDDNSTNFATRYKIQTGHMYKTSNSSVTRGTWVVRVKVEKAAHDVYNGLVCSDISGTRYATSWRRIYSKNTYTTAELKDNSVVGIYLRTWSFDVNTWSW